MQKLIKKKKAQGITLEGRLFGSLKEVTIRKLVDYYKMAIWNNKNDIPSMKQAILASLYHCVSTDQHPQHSYCPKGEKSWCFFNAAIAEKIEPGLHRSFIHTPLKAEMLDLMLPIYQRLSDDTLLERCARCLTQNANESLHSRIWNKCPKDTFPGKQYVEAAAAAAICEYNYGYEETTTKILEKSGLSVGQNTKTIDNKQDVCRLKRYDRQKTNVQKKIRSTKRLNQSKTEAEKRKQEGESYSAGGF